MQAGTGVMHPAPAAGMSREPGRAAELVCACASLFVAAGQNDGAGEGSARGSATAASVPAAPVFAIALVAPRAAVSFAACNVDGAFEGRARFEAAAAGVSAPTVRAVLLVARVSVAEHAIVAGRPVGPSAGRGRGAPRAARCGVRFGGFLCAKGTGPARRARPSFA